MSGRENERRLGVADLFLLFLLLLSVVGMLLRWQGMRALNEVPQSEIYRVLLQSEIMDRTAADCLSEGEILYDGAGQRIGIVTALRIRTAEIEREIDGGRVTGTWPLEMRCRLQVEIALEGTLRDGVLLMNDRVPLPIGQEQTLFSRRLRLHGTVIGVWN